MTDAERARIDLRTVLYHVGLTADQLRTVSTHVARYVMACVREDREKRHAREVEADLDALLDKITNRPRA